ncbi:TPA: WecB/TagA/CpsF family glycosyltransferase [Vibrio parahaemolyticus]|uniref:UDP-N-acetyl-D-mannosaminuronic acid transferase n=1 Tax=Vibrio parahaemolyticus TaxID=670 RepID=A0A7M1WKK6_VIBPH|nr:WecB/TagA/CpsF family glycosyltransferase [Vibrio parahaemolyticus]EGR0302573.1 WecB/TagA/CpsF family glycosyltransferase [Vibrio parahaemolyticus]EGR2288295.1 WecB/TagA/CpsF family glycosyltransferase [Vibrio parahaemolyticus]EJS4015323.1 WecB/TagA/CpsF family glycosyltransferase [Vibrio parahaemolyticus]ELB2272112.1 WecB/TagA/CpsF family glycosyltransferase [Vibrio parahaemolyticus]ELI5410026.1 WecB/TagA/CpsF family glycosyltransferase [Vibrio parahaemolyticus]
MNKTCEIGGLDISAFDSMDHAVDSILHQGNVVSGFAVAVNAEKIVSSYEQADVKRILESASIRYPDGAGVSLVMSKRGCPSARIPGCDLWLELMKGAAQLNVPVFIVGAKPEVNQQTVDKLKQELNVNVVDACDGYFKDEVELINRIKESQAKVITVALGSPRQENFINKCREVYPDAFYMGVGGTYDVFTDRVKRAPQWAQKYNLEWFYRLACQPTRITRQLKLVKYLSLVATKKV